MTSPDDAPSLASRHAAVRLRYRQQIAPVAARLLEAHRQVTRRSFAALGLLAVALVLAAVVLATHEWPIEWWLDRASLVRVAVALGVVSLGWRYISRTSAPLAAELGAVEAGIRQQLLPLTFRMLRDDARYRPNDAIDRGWARRSALTPHATRYDSAHLVRWTTGGADRQIAEVDTLRSRSRSDGPDSDSVIFKGLVAIAALADDTGGQVRVWSDDLPHPAPEAVSGLPRVEASRLGATRPGLPPIRSLAAPFVVEASASHVADRVVNAEVVALLNDAHGAGHRLRLTCAYRELIIGFDLERRWFRGLSQSFDEDHVVRMAAMLDLVDDLAAAVAPGGRER